MKTFYNFINEANINTNEKLFITSSHLYDLNIIFDLIHKDKTLEYKYKNTTMFFSLKRRNRFYLSYEKIYKKYQKRIKEEEYIHIILLKLVNKYFKHQYKEIEVITS